MNIELEPKKKITLEEAPLVQLDPDDLDCCGVNRPVVKVKNCCDYIPPANCNDLIHVNGVVINDTISRSRSRDITAEDLLITNASQASFNNSNITVTDFVDEVEGVSGKKYSGNADGQTLRLSFVFAVPVAYSRWIDNFLTFKIKTSGPGPANAIKLRIRDVDAVESYSTNYIYSDDWYSIIIPKNAQSLSTARWTLGLQMSIIIDVYASTGGEVYISNGVFSYI